MSFGGDVHLEREGSTVVLSATNGAQWFGALFGGFAVFWLIGWIRQESGGEFGYWFGLLLGVAFVMVGLFFLLPRKITNIFDLRSHCVLHRVSFCNGWYERRQA